MCVNLTQHKATPEQIAAGVTDLPDVVREHLIKVLTFDELPSRKLIKLHAEEVAFLARPYVNRAAMIGGAPFLMGPLTDALKALNITPVFAFSRRESVESVQPDGSVKKVAVFRHAGFVEA